MPNLPDCASTEEWRRILPGLEPPIGAGAVGGGAIPGLDPKPLERYQAAIRKQVETGIIPGYCCLVAWHDRVIHLDAFGWADLESRKPFRTDTIVRLYCMTKSLVAVGLMVLVERGCCGLEDDVARFIPAFGRSRVVRRDEEEKSTAVPLAPLDGEPPRKITLRRLMTHCSGLGYAREFDLPPQTEAETDYQRLVRRVESGAVRSLEAFCNELAALPLGFEAGERFEYSYGLDVIGRVIEVVSGQPLDVFLEEALFSPLGMCDTGFSVPDSKLSRLAAVYGSQETAQLLRQDVGRPAAEADRPAWSLVRLDGPRPEESAWAEANLLPVISGGGMLGFNRGGLVSTLNDQARFFLTIARGGELPGGPRILQESTVRDMVSHDWLRLPSSLGKPQHNSGLPGVTNKGPFGWNSLGELGVPCTAAPGEAAPGLANPDGFEPGEYGYGGIAETFWSIHPGLDLILLWFTQQVDNHSWTKQQANMWVAARKAVRGEKPRLVGKPASVAAARSRSPPLAPQQQRRVRLREKGHP